MNVRPKIYYSNISAINTKVLQGAKKMAEVKRTIYVAHSTIESFFLNDLVLHYE